MALYDRIGIGYDTTRRADPEIARRLIRLLAPHPGRRYLDLACGTANYTWALRDAGIDLAGVDISPRMLRAAVAKRTGGHWVLGDARRLPFPTGAFDGAVCTLALHHFDGLETALAEVVRVTGSGPFVTFTQGHDQTRRLWLVEYFPAIIDAAIAHMPSVERVVAALEAAGYTTFVQEPYTVAPDLQDFFMYSGKHRPAIYLDSRVRAGISAFALADPAAVDSGVARLAADIASGRIAEVMRRYEHDGGDYLFLAARRPA